MGATGSGKTTVSRVHLVTMTVNSPDRLQFINLASGSNRPLATGSGPYVTEIQLSEFTLDGRTVTLIDTPGFDDVSRKDTEILEMITTFLATE